MAKRKIGSQCCNFSLKLTIKARACKDVGQKWNPGVKFHAPRNVEECEGMSSVSHGL
jgi:hypothetical protein